MLYLALESARDPGASRRSFEALRQTHVGVAIVETREPLAASDGDGTRIEKAELK
jgi:hypothetical protein